ncbi:MAG: cold-shock protein [Alphaproteobacteria bacterium]|nr:cold-shock protein [Alphaproteobacteria bacterium]
MPFEPLTPTRRNDRATPGPSIAGPSLTATVKWFNSTKGFGFVTPSDGSLDAFLHVSVVTRAGYDNLPEGTVIECVMRPGQKGPQVDEIRRVVEMGTAVPSRSDAGASRFGSGSGFSGGGFSGGGGGGIVDGTVKFFNVEKGFGFVGPDDGGKDVFVHISALERSGLGNLQEGQRVRVTTTVGQKGPQAEKIEPI